MELTAGRMFTSSSRSDPTQSGSVSFRLHDLVAEYAQKAAAERMLSGWLALASAADESAGTG